MNNPFLKEMPAWIQVILLVALSIVCMVLGSFIATYFTAMAYGVEYDKLMDVLLYQENPQGNAIKLLTIVEQVVGFILPVVIIFYLFRNTQVKQFLIQNPGRMVIAGSAYILLSQVWVSIATLFNEWIIPENSELAKLSKPLEERADLIYDTMIQANGFGGIMLTILTMTILPAFCEEIFFRGALQPLISRIAKNVHIGIWGSAIIFSLIHLQPSGFLPRVLLGALLGYLVIWSGSLWTSIIAHFINNLLFVVMVLTINPEEISNTSEMESMPWLNYAIMFALFGIMTYYLNTISVWDKIKYDYLGIERPQPLENDLEE